MIAFVRAVELPPEDGFTSHGLDSRTQVPVLVLVIPGKHKPSEGHSFRLQINQPLEVLISLHWLFSSSDFKRSHGWLYSTAI